MKSAKKAAKKTVAAKKAASKPESALDLDSLLVLLSKDSNLRTEVIRTLAKEFPKDYLSPVQVNLRNLAERGPVLVSCKEWQE
jgi:hypothetical protein